MATNIVREDDDIVTAVAGGTIASGSVQEINGYCGVALTDAVSDDSYALRVRGVATIGKKTGETWAQFDKLYWDSSAATASKTYVSGSADQYIGLAAAAQGTSDATTGDVMLNASLDAETGDVVLKSLYDANSILYATTDNTPVALTVAASRHVGRAASGDIDDLTPAQSRVILATTTEAEGDELLGAATVGADRLVSAQIVGTQIAVAADSNVIGGIPVVHMLPIAAAAGDNDIVCTHKTRFYFFAAIKTVQAGLAGGTLTIKNGANAITNAITWDDTTADKAWANPTTIDDAYWEVAAGGTLRATTSQAQANGYVMAIGVRVA